MKQPIEVSLKGSLSVTDQEGKEKEAPEVGSVPYNPANKYDARDLVERLYQLRADPVHVNIFRCRDVATGEWGPINVQMTYDGIVLALLPWQAAKLLAKAMSYVDPEAPRDVRGADADRVWDVEKKDYNFVRHEALHMTSFLANSIDNELCTHQAIVGRKDLENLATNAMSSLHDLYNALCHEEHMDLIMKNVNLDKEEGDHD